MILSDSAILHEMKAGNIVIEDFEEYSLNACSYDVRICDRIKYTKRYSIDIKQETEWIEDNISDSGYLLSTGAIYNSMIIGNIGLKGNIAAKLLGKSSLGRLGLDITVGDVGHIESDFFGSLVIELACKQPTIIYPNIKIGQLVFFRVEGEIERYYSKVKGSKYMNQQGIQTSKYNLNF